MPSALTIAGEVAGSATALAGLILVFIGAVSASFHSYGKVAQAAIRGRYQRRVWFAFAGFSLALVSALLALAAKWLTNEFAALGALVLLFISFIWVLFAALSAVREVR